MNTEMLTHPITVDGEEQLPLRRLPVDREGNVFLMWPIIDSQKQLFKISMNIHHQRWSYQFTFKNSLIIHEPNSLSNHR